MVSSHDYYVTKFVTCGKIYNLMLGLLYEHITRESSGLWKRLARGSMSDSFRNYH